MKRVWHHPEDSSTGKRLFRSLGELHDTAEYQKRLEREFPRGAAELALHDEDDGVSRRRFMRLMGASTALAGLGMAACRRPVGKILPYAGSVEWMVPGKAVYYATAMPRANGATPIVAKIHEGRPVHLQGNPLHPGAGGGTDHFAIASILDLYDPERSSSYKKGNAPVAREEFRSFFSAKKKQLADSGGEGLAFLHGAGTSPTRQRLAVKILEKFPKAKFFEYEAVDREGQQTATAKLYGARKELRFHLERADRILSIGCDFLGIDRVADDASCTFSARRHVEGEVDASSMNRLYVLEHQYTVTGGMADHRRPVKVGDLPLVTAHIAAKVGELTGDKDLVALAGPLVAASDKRIKGVLSSKWIEGVAKDLLSARGKGVVLAGPRLDAGIHALVIAMNVALGNVGDAQPVEVVTTDIQRSANIGELAAAMKAGEVSTLVISAESDPVYSAPADLGFAGLLSKVETTIHIGVRDLCASAHAADWHVPGAHYLESWGDVRSSDGTYSVVQPMIAPLFNGVSDIAFLADLLADKEPAGDTDAGLSAVKETFAAIIGNSGENQWNTLLRNGFLKDSAYKATAKDMDRQAAKQLVDALQVSKGGFELVFTADNKVWDGRYINNGWLQELPDPITSLVWDNAALMSFATIKELAKKAGKEWSNKDLVIEDKAHLLKVNAGGVVRYFPIIPAPGHAKDSVSISMGYGQVNAGSIAGTPQSDSDIWPMQSEDNQETTGFDVFALRTSGSSLHAEDIKIELVTEEVELREGYSAKTYPIALTQEHFMMEGRALYRDGTIKELEHERDHYDPAHPEHASAFQKRGMDSHIPPNHSVYRGQDLTPDGNENQQWAMAIDLNLCNGCNACTIACQSENNIPIVGKDQVIIGREMHWIRMDRYFAPDMKEDDHGHWDIADEDLENPQLMPQPVSCTQCEAAPCETVCPVNATVHTEEGLNAMAYNRCIGTRYCANNCPYKARRFNFFDYNKRPLDQLYRGPLSDKDKTGMAPSLQLQKNPNVTVRMRGVMEKCTYCVQRIQEAKINQKRIARDSDDTRVPDGVIKVACQSACSCDAITFGDLTDKDSAINKVKASPRNYEMLKYLGLRERTTYLARIKNPNMDMPGAEQIGTISTHFH